MASKQKKTLIGHPARRTYSERAPRERSLPGLTARATEVEAPPHYGAGQVKRLRKKLGVSQTVFANMLNVSNSTIRSWEQGLRIPDGSSLRLLELVDENPGSVMARLETGITRRVDRMR